METLERYAEAADQHTFEYVEKEIHKLKREYAKGSPPPSNLGGCGGNAGSGAFSEMVCGHSHPLAGTPDCPYYAQARANSLNQDRTERIRIQDIDARHTNEKAWHSGGEPPGAEPPCAEPPGADPLGTESPCALSGNGLGWRGECTQSGLTGERRRAAELVAAIRESAQSADSAISPTGLGEQCTLIIDDPPAEALAGCEPALLGDGTPLLPTQLGHLLCQSSIIRTVFSGPSTVPDVGRATRLYSDKEKVRSSLATADVSFRDVPTPTKPAMSIMRRNGARAGQPI